MNFREATTNDIEELHVIRMSVKENVLSNPLLVQPQDYEAFLTEKGKGWLCEIDGKPVGFAIVDTERNNLWALFLSPEYERKGIGRQLHDRMLDWCRKQGISSLWLTTDPKTRARKFYEKAGWKETGTTTSGEVRMEISL
jgi:GNAT superfamily N-acetyltransferase